MNAMIPLFGLLLLTAGAFVWAVLERGRAERAAAEVRLLREQASAGADALRAQAAQSAEQVAQRLVQSANDTFAHQERLVQARLEAQLKPVAETLEKVQQQVSAVEKSRAEETGGLKAQIEALMRATSETQTEARRLSQALRRGAGVQGRWGEQMLRNVLEMAGLRAGYDFDEQTSLETAEGRLRPDVTVRLPGNAVFVIDAKCSLNAYLEAQDQPDEAAREEAYQRHAQSVRAHMQGLSAKAYWSQFERAPDFVVMFVPGDPILAAAAERQPDLFVQAMDRRVVLVAPSGLFALCKAVAYGWRAEEQAVNARQIADLGRELYKRLSTMGEHVSQLGRALGSAVTRYNAFVGSLETQVLVQARRLEDLKADHESSRIEEVRGLDTAPRPLTKLAPASTTPQAPPPEPPRPDPP
ncbi:MAG: DNA recombination protein RmuC [Alphaproteobacteria bacterium]|nr:DNA recombination protein RmuC [Alphaproteobacteria bacterium]